MNTCFKVVKSQCGTLLTLLVVVVSFLPRPAYCQASPIKVLFLGNSYTYYNNMPSILEQLSANSGEKNKIVTKLIASGGATLKNHWEDKETVAVLKGKWDYVVLQEQTFFGTLLFVNGEEKTFSPEVFDTYAGKIDSLVRKQGGKTIVLMRPFYGNGSPVDKLFSNAIYNDFAKRSKSILVPAAITIEKLKALGYLFFREDSLHPTPLSSYAMAASLFIHIYKKPVVSDQTLYKGIKIEEDDGKVDPDSLVILANLKKEEVETVNKFCWDDYERLKGGYMDLPLKNNLSFPKLPKTVDNIIVAELNGNWSGVLKLYPRFMTWPAKLSLNFIEGDSLRVNAKIDFGLNNTNDVNFNAKVSITHNEIHFTSNKGPDDSILKFTGVIYNHKLTGIAEFIKRDNKYFYGIGDWDASRVVENK